MKRLLHPVYLSAAAVFWASGAAAQTNLAGAYVDGQVFLRWTLAPGVVHTYDVYASVAAQSSTANMLPLGRLFPEEATGERMHNLRPSATLRVPNGSGYTTLTTSEGAFAWTPHQAGALYFAVVENGQTAVTNANRVQVTFGYDPVNEPVKPHFQFAGTTTGGYPFFVYTVWVDGRSDPEDGRPDFPVMANAHRGGVPHVFAVTTPIGGLPGGSYPAVFCLHGGEGAYQNFMPGEPERANMSIELNDGIVITPDDNLYWQSNILRQSTVTAWFGYAKNFDPFTMLARSDPPNDEVIVNYTARRVLWFTDWLTSGQGPFDVDPHRVALIGHSAGSRGVSHLSRHAPEKFSAAVIQSSLLNFPDPDGPYPPLGRFSQNLATNIISPDTGLPLTHQQVLTPSVRLSGQPYVPYTRLYVGKRDDNAHGGWTPTARAGLDGCNDSQLGLIVSWDEREHGVDLWSTESPDILDDPSHCDPWPDIGQWIYPVRTERHGAQYLADRFRNDRSHPGFFDVDEDAQTLGRQPDPGPGDPCSPSGAPWGTWGGYLDWADATIVDTPERWECTLFLRGLSGTTIDNSPISLVRTSVAPRRTQQFHPAAGSTVNWTLQIPVAGPVVQSGQVSVDSNGVAKIAGLLIPREDVARARLVISQPPCDPDVNCDGSINGFDIEATEQAINGDYSNFCQSSADLNGDGAENGFDIEVEEQRVNGSPC